MDTVNYLDCIAASLGKGMSVDYFLKINGHKVRTTGTVVKIRRVGMFQIEITLKHRHTGEIHTNVMEARDRVLIFAAFLQPGYTKEVQTGLPGTMDGLADIWTESLMDQLNSTIKQNQWNLAGMPIES